MDYSKWPKKYPWVMDVYEHGRLVYLRPDLVAKHGGKRKGAGRPKIHRDEQARKRAYYHRHGLDEIKKNTPS
jgi:hypothetical protein